MTHEYDRMRSQWIFVVVGAAAAHRLLLCSFPIRNSSELLLLLSLCFTMLLLSASFRIGHKCIFARPILRYCIAIVKFISIWIYGWTKGTQKGRGWREVWRSRSPNKHTLHLFVHNSQCICELGVQMKICWTSCKTRFAVHSFNAHTLSCVCAHATFISVGSELLLLLLLLPLQPATQHKAQPICAICV